MNPEYKEYADRSDALLNAGYLERTETGKYQLSTEGNRIGGIHLVNYARKKHLPEVTGNIPDRAHFEYILNCLERDGLINQSGNSFTVTKDGTQNIIYHFLQADDVSERELGRG